MTLRVRQTPPLFFTAALLLAALPAVAQDAEGQPMSAAIAAPDGAALGTVTLQPTTSGQTIVTLELTNLPAGTHGVHIHETGDCSAADFTSAGGHLADGKAHGVMAADGSHPGDLPNLHVPESGAITVEYFAPALTAALLADADGSALVIHADPDDYSGQPSGNAGDRIGCGAFAPAN